MVGGAGWRIDTRLLVRSIVAIGRAIALIIYIPTNVNAIFFTQEEVVGNAIVTLCGKIVRVIRTMTITVAHVGFGNAL